MLRGATAAKEAEAAKEAANGTATLAVDCNVKTLTRTRKLTSRPKRMLTLGMVSNIRSGDELASDQEAAAAASSSAATRGVNDSAVSALQSFEVL